MGIASANCFLFGNLVPDIYVGYMVQPLTKTLSYCRTHVAVDEFMPTPCYNEFWDLYVVPLLADGPSPERDLALGAWAHLVCDHSYNLAARKVALAAGYKPGDGVRVLKQSDFDDYGKSLSISMVPKLTPTLIRAAHSFSQYPIDKPDVTAAIDAAQRIVDTNTPAMPSPSYRLLSTEFFETTAQAAHNIIISNLLDGATQYNTSSS
ncbi:hypothetical protein [Atopobium fossor]|uniref:hypothetical protein n=1 Tax=Atopobium fossor TaxID=39487 RepID=UPI0004041ED2|nr:hypothetical protein [Atopobium fossor]